MAVRRDKDRDRDANPDPITGAPGAHPVGTGLGAAAAGAAGAAMGAPAGPVGALVGAAIGAIAGGLIGKGAAEAVNPTEEEAYWRDTYHNRPYVDKDRDFDTWRPAYKYGWESRTKHPQKTYDQAEKDLERDWNTYRGTSTLGWDKARHATRDAWERVDYNVVSRDLDRDDDYWRENFRTRSYVSPGESYESYAPAYKFGRECYWRHHGRNWNEAEPEVRSEWERTQGKAGLQWEKAKAAIRDSWHRIEERIPGDADRDRR